MSARRSLYPFCLACLSAALWLSIAAVGTACDDEDPPSDATPDADAGDQGEDQTVAPDLVADGDTLEELEPVLCGSLSESECRDSQECQWLVASCPDEFIAAACFGEGISPQPPPCAPQPCRSYLDETACEAEFACNWWPVECLPEGVLDPCRNVGHGPGCEP